MQTICKQAIEISNEKLWCRLLESLIFEGVLVPTRLSSDEPSMYSISGIDEVGQPVTYEFVARELYTFGMLRLLNHPVIRNNGRERTAASHLPLFIEETISRIITDHPVQPLFLQELEATRKHEGYYQNARMKEEKKHRLADANLAQLECRSSEGHPYHPCFRSRIGFTEADNQAYGPEYEPELHIYWLAVRQEKVRISLCEGMEWQQLLSSQLLEHDRSRFQSQLELQQVSETDYCYLPVHPWQWHHHLKILYRHEIERQEIIPLGFSSAVYIPQQSIRTWSSVHQAVPSDMKLSLHIINTSSIRDLTIHSVASAPRVSQWLQTIINQDDYLKNDAKLILLHEYAGISYLPAKGAASAIWRESVLAYLEDEEEAVPFHALTACDYEGSPYLAPWIARFGVERWFSELIRRTIIPVVHLLVAHGIVLESHAQNMILIHRKGIPVRAALRDTHEGVEYYLPFTPAVELIPDFAAIDCVYANSQLGDYYEMPSLESLQEMMTDALWLMNIGYLIMFLSEHFEYEEAALWRIVAAELENYKLKNDHLASRFDALQFYKPSCVIEPLAQKRLYGTVKLPPREMPNPLYLAQKELHEPDMEAKQCLL